ncbi:hypothetical protein FIV01_06605 [Vibrio aquimaris]|uniref:Uncharacterized protein n=1 Tax=Vibrio aquimaris TaxID=2587862 RepID=A0A5P9CJA9_9VIBR|nr:hypothetical protein FIV01_06605 [Vibrio aquimaris]
METVSAFSIQFIVIDKVLQIFDRVFLSVIIFLNENHIFIYWYQFYLYLGQLYRSLFLWRK